MTRLNALTATLLLLLSACGDRSLEYHDAQLQLSKRDYEKTLLPPSSESKEKESLKPHVAPTLQQTLPEIFQKTVSVSALDDVPVKDLLFQISRQAQINISIAPDVKGSITFSASNHAYIDIVTEICSLTQLRYTIKGNLIRIQPDKPYLHSYDASFLSHKRQNQNRVSVVTDVFSTSDSKTNTLDNGSNTVLSTSSESDLWQELQGNLKMLLHAHDDAANSKHRYTLNKQAGLISVYATQAQHKKIKKFLDQVKNLITAQVIIEAKIIEIHLNDEYKSGVNWNSLKGDFTIQSPFGPLSTPGPFRQDATPARDVLTLGGHGHHLTGLINLMEKFGTVRTLANPRITVMNNQSAVLKVGTNGVYFRLEYSREYGFESERERESVTSQIKSVPIGLVMVVHPCINIASGSIVMNLRPTISRIVDEKEDPAVAIASKQMQKSLIPEVQMREFDSVIHMKSGELVVLGGLMENRSDHLTTGIPGARDAGFFGELFKGRSHKDQITELVVLLKATIIDHSDSMSRVVTTSVHPQDQKLYTTLTSDPRLTS
jgi:MSHA type pilus biogenesis protein MshL